MAIIDTITNDNALYEALQKTQGYKNSFSYEGAQALQLYLEQLSDGIGENIEFDPIGWACEYSEYKDYEGFQNDTGGYDDITNLDEVRDRTEVIEFDGGLIVRNF